MVNTAWPERVVSVEDLEELLSRPTDQVCHVLGQLSGDLLLLGAGGKMGLSLARMARRAWNRVGHRGRVIAVSRFGDGGEALFHAQGIDTLRCDLLNPEQLRNLPQAANVIAMVWVGRGSESSVCTRRSTGQDARMMAVRSAPSSSDAAPPRTPAEPRSARSSPMCLQRAMPPPPSCHWPT